MWLRGLRQAHAHPTTLSRYLDDDLAPSEREGLEGHVGACIPCQRFLRSLSQTIGGLRSLGMSAPAALPDTIIAATTSEVGAARPAVVGGECGRAPISWRRGVRGALRYCMQRSQLRLTVPIALIVGAALTVVNQGGMLLDGQIDLGMCAICGADFVVPFVAMNLVLLTAARPARRR
jgi:anti-sigma factor RsiW